MSPMIWLGIMIVMIVIEAVSFGLTSIWFAGGALAAAVLAFFTDSIVLQLLVFFGVSVVLLLFTRPLAKRSLERTDKVKTNADSLIGREAVVTKEINNLSQTGQVRINDIDWTARSVDGDEIIPERAVVVIESIQGVKLYVKKKEGGSL